MGFGISLQRLWIGLDGLYRFDGYWFGIGGNRFGIYMNKFGIGGNGLDMILKFSYMGQNSIVFGSTYIKRQNCTYI